MLKVDIHRVLYVLKCCGTFTCTWPVDKNAGKFVILLNNIGWCISMLNAIVVLIPLSLAVYYRRDDIIVLMKTISELTALSEVFLDLIFCRIEKEQLQDLLGKVKAFVEKNEKQERQMIQRYVDRYTPFFSMVGMAYILAGVAFSFGPLFLAQNLPGDGWYPFPVDPPGTYCLIYTIQVYSVLQTMLCIGVDFTLAVLFSIPAARLDLLGLKVHKASNEEEIKTCIKEHQEIIGFVEQTQMAVENLLFKANITMGVAVMCGAFPLINNQPFAILSQFLSLVMGACGRLYVIAWPADDLKESSKQFAISAYNCDWVGKSPEMLSSVLIMIQRSQKPLVISMGGLLPLLSLEYFASFLTTVISYFMTMRTVIDK